MRKTSEAVVIIIKKYLKVEIEEATKELERMSIKPNQSALTTSFINEQGFLLKSNSIGLSIFRRGQLKYKYK
jgi:hypothetical protein